MRACLLVLALLLALPAQALRPYRGGAVATQHALATEAALEMLEKGGNAADAATAAAFVLAVAGPYHSGLGGGGFAVVHQVGETPKTWALDFREVAPKAASRDMFVRDGKAVPELSRNGGLAIGVPGAVAGYLELQARAGKLSRRVVLAPAIKLAREGFHVTPNYRRMASRRAECLSEYGEAGRIFLTRDAQGQAVVPPNGHVVRQPELAKTLQAIAAQGSKGFYRGRIAQQLVAGVKEAGGLLSLEDLSEYRVRTPAPLLGSYRGHRIATFPPPSAGGVALLQTLGVLEQAFPQGVPYASPDALHVLVEALRRSYLDRVKHLGDPAFNELPVERLISDAYVQQLLAGIDRKKATRSVTLIPKDAPKGAGEVAPKGAGEVAPKGAGAPPKHDDGSKNTSHLSVVDKWGNAVALTTTVNTYFGSCVVPKGTGVLMNNEMDDFAAQPWVPNAFGLVTGVPNAVAPGKIPLSSMTPTIVFQKDDAQRVRVVLGSPGGSTIPTTVLQTLVHVIDHDMDIARAVSAGRIHHQFLPDDVRMDDWGLEPATREVLTRMGHTLVQGRGWGDAEAVHVAPDSGLRTAASDPRGEGLASGHD